MGEYIRFTNIITTDKVGSRKKIDTLFFVLYDLVHLRLLFGHYYKLFFQA